MTKVLLCLSLFFFGGLLGIVVDDPSAPVNTQFVVVEVITIITLVAAVAYEAGWQMARQSQ